MIEQLLVLTAGLLAVPAPKDDVTKDKIEGTWVVVAETSNGKPNSKTKGNKITFKGGTVTVTSKEKEEKGSYKVNASSKPTNCSP